ncbi:MAG: amidohydrolase family protein [Thermoplasmatales archaeon]|nr:amidohydrolase family protein [Thermoplasmatales archaeon]
MGATDCHVHLSPLDEMRPGLLAMLGAGTPELRRVIEHPKAFLEMLDRAGVERAVIINYLSPKVIGYTERVNEFSARYARADPARLIPSGGIEADHPDPKREITRLVREMGIRAIKLHPPHQLFYPNDYLEGRPHPRLREIYATAEELHIPVIFHTGTSVFPQARNRFGDPLHLDDVAVDFPQLTIVLAHAGRPIWMQQALFLARRFPNVWLELSGIPPGRLPSYLPRLAEFASKAIFGTDWPGPGVRDLGANFEAFRALGLPTDVQRAILEENPKKVFRPA